MRYRDVVLEDSPVGYWRLGDQGSIAVDEMGRLDGTYRGNCTHGATGALVGDPDLSVQLDGTSCGIDFGDNLAFFGTASFTIEMWVRERVTSTYQVFFMKQSRVDPNPLDGYAILNSPTGMYFERYINQLGINSLPAPIPAGRFLHIVGVYDGAFAFLYIDGALAGMSNPDTTPMPMYSAPAWAGSMPAGFNVVEGNLDELAIYASALTPERIAIHHDIGVSGPQ